MYGTKKIANTYKGIFALVLMLFFAVSAFGKGLAVKTTFSHKSGKESAGKYLLTAIEADDDANDFFSQLTDNDADDADFVLPGFITAPKPLSIQGSTANTFANYAACTKFYNIALYDLYCNWKFHL